MIRSKFITTTIIILSFYANISFANVNAVQNNSAATNNLAVKINLDKENKDLEAKIISSLSLSKEQDNISEDRIGLLFSVAQKEINELLAANGYFNSKIGGKLKRKEVSFDVMLGDPVIIKESSIKIIDPNNAIDETNKILDINKIEQGKILVTANYEAVKEEILAELIDLGYLKAKFSEHVIKLDKEQNSAFISLKIKLGNRFYFGDVRFISDKYSDDLLKSYIPFSKRAPYTAKNLEKLRESFLNSGFFTKVRLYPKPNLTSKGNNIVPVQVKLVEKLNNRYQGSIGYGTNTGYRGSVGWLRRHIGKKGMTLNTTAQISGISKSAHAALSIPSQEPNKTMYYLKSNLVEEKINKHFSRKVEFIAERAQDLENISRNINLYYIDELYKTKPTDPKDRSRFLLPEFKYHWKKSTEEYFCCGQSFGFRTRAGINEFISETDLLQVDADYKYILGITKNTRIIFRVEAGSIFANDFEKVPVSMRYYTGGDNSVRGFAYKSVGPREIDNDGTEVVVGGRHKLLTSIELERRIKESISLAGFVDAGKAYNHFDEQPWSVGSGVGVRFLSPLGSLKIDVATPVSNRLSSRKIRLHIGFSKDL